MAIDEGADNSTAYEMMRSSRLIHDVAHSFTSTINSDFDHDLDPCFAKPNSPLNPNSPKFNGLEWAKAVVELYKREGIPMCSTGVCFQNLTVSGFGAFSGYQKNVANVWLSVGSLMRRLAGSMPPRINILRSFDGIVNSGQMLVVLGPPGSGCSTLLKTLAGEMNGIHVNVDSYLSYQGE